MQLYVAILALMFLTYCGTDSIMNKDGVDGTNGTSCTTIQTASGAKVTCEDGSSAVITNGSPGNNGTNGVNGDKGSKGDTGPKGDKGEVGPKGDTGAQGEVGPQGETGPSGKNGLDGLNGTNGIDGKDGAAGMPGLPGSIIAPIIPCPTSSGAYPEVLLCIDNNLYAVFIQNTLNETRYTKIPPGNYRTTDGRSCNFTLVSGCYITY